MTNLKNKIAAVLATGSLLLNAMPVGATFTIVQEGNGTGSNNDTTVNMTNDNYVDQSNVTELKNKVDIKSNTGDNEADDNTNGDVNIETGDIDTAVSIMNTLGSNHAVLRNCGACDLDVEVNIEGNGSDSDNNVDLDLEKTNEVFQANESDVENKVETDSTTGDNDANDNTGGDVKIKTGDITTLVLAETHAGFNALRVGGANGSGNVLSARIVGNGSDSDNDIDLDFTHSNYFQQDNDTDVETEVEVDSSTGENEADDNTNGEVLIDTGDVDAGVGILNRASFNAIDFSDCGCAFDGLAKIAGNGSESESDVDLEVSDDLEVFQNNEEDLENEVEGDLETGDNEADDNTGGVEGYDPSIMTGDVEAVASLENTTGVNTFGSDLDLDLHFDMAAIWAALGL